MIWIQCLPSTGCFLGPRYCAKLLSNATHLFSQELCEICITVPLLQMRELKLTEDKQLVQVHVFSKAERGYEVRSPDSN